jgi:hypothetical protein
MREELVHRENRNRTRRKHPAAASPQTGLQWTTGAALAALAGYMVHAWLTGLIEPGEFLWLAILAMLCLLPTVRWFQTGMRHLPLGEGFAAMHLAYYVIPCLGPPQGETEYYTGVVRVQALIGLVVFLGAFVISYWMVLRWRRPMFAGLGVLRREINLATVRFLFGVWVVAMLALQSGFIPNLGILRNEFMSALGALGSIAVVSLFYRLGQNRLEGVSRLWLFGGLVLGLAASFASGSLIYGATVLGAALLAFSLGRKRLPVIATIAVVLVVGLLQLGKNDYRSAAFGNGAEEDYIEAPSGLVQAYHLWLGAAWNAFTKKSVSSSEELPIFQRTSLIQIMALAMETVPGDKTYVYGASYAMLPEMMVPRIFWAGKLRATTPTEDLGIYLGIQTVEGSQSTGIAIGPPAEAWLNFGWLGLAAAGAFLGLFFGYPARMSRHFQPRQIGWLLTCIFLVDSIDLEHSVPELCNSLLQTLFVGFILLFFISRQPAGRSRTRISNKATAPLPDQGSA